MTSFIKKGNIQVKVEVQNWEEAIRKAGALLLNNNSITEAYIDEMVAAIHNLGPYIVIAPHIALAHARPGESVLKNDISLITLKEPVHFGSEHNDPVHIVFSFCAKESDSHIKQLTDLAGLLDNADLIKQISESGNKQEVYEMLNKKNEE